MKTYQLRDYLNKLPKELDNFEIVYSEAFEMESGNIIRKDVPIESVGADQHNEELIIGKRTALDTIENRSL